MLKTIAAFDRIGEENAFAVLARANALAAQGRDIINLGIGQPDFRTPEFIVEAAIKALRDGHHGYTPANGIPPLREAVAADLHKRFKVEVSPKSVMIMPGGKPTMFMSILMFGEPGVDILYPDPGFPIYRSMIEYTGARPVPVPVREENGFAFSAEETLKLITPQTRLLILNSPANPTGGVTGKAEVDKLVAGLEKFPDVCVMSDEIYDHMVYDGVSNQRHSARDVLVLEQEKREQHSQGELAIQDQRGCKEDDDHVLGGRHNSLHCLVPKPRPAGPDIGRDTSFQGRLPVEKADWLGIVGLDRGDPADALD